MLDRLIDFAVHKRALTLGLTLAFAAFGVVTLSKLKIEAFPEVTNVQVMVITLYADPAKLRATGLSLHGLISSTLLTMLLLPTLYELADRWFGSGRIERRFARAWSGAERPPPADAAR